MSHQELHVAVAAPHIAHFGRTAAPTAPMRHDQNARAQVEDHPVFAALFETTRALLLDGGDTRALDIGETLHSRQSVTFVLEGMIGKFAPGSKVCVGVVGSGGLMGLEAAVGMEPSTSSMALAETRIFEAPASLLVEGLGRARVTDLCMRHALIRLDTLQAEATCNALHLVPQRLAKWLARLHRANRAKEIRLTQGEIAQLMGVQRTAVNGAVRQLQDASAVRCSRGRIIIQDLDTLTRSSCGCPL